MVQLMTNHWNQSQKITSGREGGGGGGDLSRIKCCLSLDEY